MLSNIFWLDTQSPPNITRSYALSNLFTLDTRSFKFDLLSYRGSGDNGLPVQSKPVEIYGKLSLNGKPASNVSFGVEDPISMQSRMISTDKDGTFSFETAPVKTPGIYLFTFFYEGKQADNLVVGVPPSPFSPMITVEDTEFKIKLGHVGGPIKQDDFTAFVAFKTDRVKKELKYSDDFLEKFKKFARRFGKNLGKSVVSSQSVASFTFIGAVCAIVGAVPTGAGQVGCGVAFLMWGGSRVLDAFTKSVEESSSVSEETKNTVRKVETAAKTASIAQMILTFDVPGLLVSSTELLDKGKIKKAEVTDFEVDERGMVKYMSLEAETESGKFIIMNATRTRNGMTFIGKSPIDLLITSPSGKKFGKEIQELEGKYYEFDMDEDGDLDDVVMIFEPEEGEFEVNVIPEEGAKPDDTFTLEVDTGKEVKVLAEEVKISQVSEKPAKVKIEKEAGGEVKVLKVEPIKPKIPWDLNDDGLVNIFDLVVVGKNFGGKGPEGDVNGDGKVDVFDLVLVGRHFGEQIGAGPFLIREEETKELKELWVKSKLDGEWLTVQVGVSGLDDVFGYQLDLSFDVDEMELMSVQEGGVFSKAGRFYWKAPEVEKGMVRDAAAVRLGDVGGVSWNEPLLTLRFRVKSRYDLLRTNLWVSNVKVVSPDGELIGELRGGRGFELERVVVPARSELLANYPNPFNPDTWIPFALAKEAEVIIRIYDVSGRLIRELNLGRLSAGYYVSRDRAAHWDGRNERGERAASGVYVVELIAGKGRFVRRIALMK